MKLNERLVSLRRDKRMSQQDLAKALSISRRVASRWEVGIVIPSVDNLLASSKLFGVPMDELMGDDKVVGVPKNEKTQGSGNRKGRSVLKIILITLAAAALAAAIVTTYPNRKDTEPGEQNTVKFKGLEEERVSGSDTVISGPIS